jgi:hypothetical protein
MPGMRGLEVLSLSQNSRVPNASVIRYFLGNLTPMGLHILLVIILHILSAIILPVMAIALFFLLEAAYSGAGIWEIFSKAGLDLCRVSIGTLAQSNVLRRSLHPILNALEVAKAGFHAFRRFRATHLSKSRVPESLVKFWMGHSETNQTEEYVKLFDEVVYRREVADSIGMGFDVLPEKPIVRKVRRKLLRADVGVAA